MYIPVIVVHTTYLKSVEKGKKEVSNFSRFVDKSGPKAFSKNL